MAQENAEDIPVIDKFFGELMLTGKILELWTKIKPEHTTEELFSYLWSLDEAHKILTPGRHLPFKSKEAASLFCSHGETGYKLNDLCQALRFYNFAILSAPHPDTSTDIAKTHGKNMHEELAQAYASRVVVLFDLKQYTKCSDDIDRALELCCDQSRRKLLDRKCICLKLISEGHEKTFDASAEALQNFEPCFAYVNPEPPKLKDHNPAIPSFSSAVKLANTHSSKLPLIADRDINPGEIVYVEEGYCNTALLERIQMYCTVCLRQCMAPLPCPTCPLVMFCSEDCRKEGLSGIHWKECPIVATLSLMENGSFLSLACRLMIKTSHAKLREMMPLLQQEAKNQHHNDLGFNQNGIYDTSDYRSVYHMTTYKDKLSSQVLLKICIEAFIATKLLERSGRYFVSCDGEPFTPSHEDIILTGSTLIHHMMSLYSNTSIGIPMFNVNDKKKCHQELCGKGVYSASSLMNHSCNPNCSTFYYGTTVIARAIHFIPAGKTLTITYAGCFTEHGRDIRRLTLLLNFHFTCTCEACENNWPTTTNLSQSVILKCPKCDGEGINSITKICPNCHLNYDEGSMQEGAPYNFSLICRKIEKILQDYFIAKKSISLKGSNSETDTKVVRTLIKIFCKYVKQPNTFLNDAIITFQMVCLDFVLVFMLKMTFRSLC